MKKQMKKGVVFMLICCFIAGFTSCAENDGKSKVQEEVAKDYAASPETLIEELAKRAGSKDLEEVEELFVLEEYEERLDSSFEIEGVPPKTMEERRQDVYKQIMSLYVPLCFEDKEEMFEYMLSEPGQDQLMELLKEQDFSDLEIVRVDLPDGDEELHKERISDIPDSRLMYGVDGWDYRIALISHNGNTYFCGFQYFIYDGKYMIHDFECPMLAIAPNMPVFLCTQEDYIELIESGE